MLNRNLLALMSLIIIFIVGCSSGSSDSAGGIDGTNDNSESGLPNSMTWSVYDVGASGYTEMSAIADMLKSEYGVSVNMLPSASGVGRMTALKDQVATIAKVGDESQFSFEGTEEFATRAWGPQDVRAVWAPVSHYGFASLEKSDIDTFEDLKGKKVPYFPGNSTVNVKSEAILAFGGLTWDDVDVVELTSYGDQSDALIQGKIDVVSGIPNSAAFVEVDSHSGIKWLEMDPDDSEGWDRVKEIAPWLFPETRDEGAGIEEDTDLIGYGYLVASYADAEDVKALITAMDAKFDVYKGALQSLEYYAKDKVATEPRGIPFHDETIEFFKENNMWDDEKQAKNDELVERQKKLAEVWEQVLEEADQQGISDDDFPEFWLERKEELMD